MAAKLTLKDLSDLFAAACGEKKNVSETFVRTFFDIIKSMVRQGQQVKIKGLGTFKIQSVGSRESVNVNTGERMEISGYRRVVFIPDKTLAQRVNSPFENFTSYVLDEGGKADQPAEADGLLDGDVNADLSADVDLSVNGDDGDFVYDTSEYDLEAALLAMPDCLPDDEGTEAGDADESAETEPAAKPETEAETNVETATDAEAVGNDAEAADDDDVFINTVYLGDSPAEDATDEEDDPDEPEALADEDSDNKEEGGTEADDDSHADPSDDSLTEAEEEDTDTQSGDEVECEDGYDDEAEGCHWMRTMLLSLVGLLLLAAAYFTGYYRLLGRTDLPSVEAVMSLFGGGAAVADSAEAAPLVKAEPDSAAVAATVDSLADTEPGVAMTHEDSLYAATADYEQLADGDFLIAGTMLEHRMREGESLLNLAIKHYRNKDMARYIAFYNHIANPDVIPLGQNLLLPILVEKKP